MDKKYIYVGAVVIFIIALFFVGMIFLAGSDRTRALSVPITALDDKIQEHAVAPLSGRAKKSAFIAWGRNPFVLERATSQTDSNLYLRGIVWSENDPHAIINDTILRVGDRINSNTVVEIKKEAVVLYDGLKNFEITLES